MQENNAPESNAASSNRALVEDWFENVWNKGDLAAIDRLLAPDAIGHGLRDEDGKEMVGPAGMKPFVAKFKEAFPDLRIEAEQMVSEGDLIAARCIVRGTHTGAGLGLEVTHRPIEITGMTMVRVRDGQIVEGWNNFDFQALFAQLQEDRAAS